VKINYRLNTAKLAGIRDEAAWAESMGFDGVCSNETAHDSFIPLSLAATSTSKVKLETRVAIAFPRSPMITSYLARDINELSEGRFRLGLGTQVKGHIERRFSTKWESPSKKLKEYISSIRAIWNSWQTDEKLNYEGEFYNFSLMTPFFSPGKSEFPDPEIFTAAVNNYNCRVAGEVSDGLMLHTLTSPEYVRDVVIPNVQKGEARTSLAKPKTKITGGGFIVAGPNRAAITDMMPSLKMRIGFYSSTRTYAPVLETHGLEEMGPILHKLSTEQKWDEIQAMVTDEMVNAFSVIGEYDEIADLFHQKYSGLLDEVNLSFFNDTYPDDQTLQNIVSRFHELS
jgi:probable F420-dependent oxidoreductase|tara:strand:+ start:1151 stop:2173 length:1023 start_codon:yes stop_codon:yes gene_type:complete